MTANLREEGKAYDALVAELKAKRDDELRGLASGEILNGEVMLLGKVHRLPYDLSPDTINYRANEATREIERMAVDAWGAVLDVARRSCPRT